jgi:hypothetical protein
MTLAEPAALAAPQAAGPVAPSVSARPAGAAVYTGAAALYAASRPRGTAPWERRSHAFQVIYLERARVAFDAGLDVVKMARVLADHTITETANGVAECQCGNWLGLMSGNEPELHQAAALRAWALGDPS